MHDLTRRSRQWTDEVLVDHADTYGEFRVRELAWHHDPAGHDRLRDRFERDATGGPASGSP